MTSQRFKYPRKLVAAMCYDDGSSETGGYERNGERIQYRGGDIRNTFLHRSNWTKKSRKSFTCFNNCEIDVGEAYLRLDLMTSEGCASSIIEVALCWGCCVDISIAVGDAENGEESSMADANINWRHQMEMGGGSSEVNSQAQQNRPGNQSVS